MERVKQRGRNIAVALAAAMALVLHLVAVAQARPVQLDIFGNPICVTAVDGNQHAPRKNGGHEGIDCCLLGCGAPVAGPPPASTMPAAISPGEICAIFAAPASSCPAAFDWRPGNPRAPPLTV